LPIEQFFPQKAAGDKERGREDGPTVEHGKRADGWGKRIEKLAPSATPKGRRKKREKKECREGRVLYPPSASGKRHFPPRELGKRGCVGSREGWGREGSG